MGVKGEITIIFPTENGWDETRHMNLINPITDCKVRVTSVNAEPVEANVVIYRDKKRIEIK